MAGLPPGQKSPPGDNHRKPPEGRHDDEPIVARGDGRGKSASSLPAGEGGGVGSSASARESGAAQPAPRTKTPRWGQTRQGRRSPGIWGIISRGRGRPVLAQGGWNWTKGGPANRCLPEQRPNCRKWRGLQGLGGSGDHVRSGEPDNAHVRSPPTPRKTFKTFTGPPPGDKGTPAHPSSLARRVPSPSPSRHWARASFADFGTSCTLHSAKV